MAIWNERIREKRLQKGITLAQIADKLGVTEATAQRYESGSIKSVPYEHMCAYGEILGCSPAYLMGWEDINTKDKYNMISSTHSAEIDKFANYLFLSERNGINSSNKNEYIEFIIAEKTYELNETGKMEALKRVEELAEIPRYSSELLLNAAHARTDIDIPEGTDTSEDDIMDDENF